MRIGLLTSGGDCAGLNAVIRAVVKRAVLGYGWQVLGIRRRRTACSAAGRRGRADPRQHRRHPAPRRHLARYHQSGRPVRLSGSNGGTVDRSAEIAAGYHELGLGALIGVGGDGSLAILRQLAQRGDWRLIGIPKTIDNDLGHTERAIGFRPRRSRSRPRRSIACT